MSLKIWGRLIFFMENFDIFKIFDTLTDAVAVISDGRVIYANTPALSLYGAEIVGRDAAQYFDALLLEHSGDTVHGGVLVGGERIAASASDVEGLRVITAKAPAALPKLPELAPEISDELAVCSFGVDLAASRLDSAADERTAVYLARASKALHSITRIVNNYSLLFGGTRGLRESSFDLVTVVTDLISTVDYLTRARAVTITCRASQQSVPYYGDLELIERMLLNLFSNSLKYCEDGSAITVHITKQSSYILLELRDEGSGVPPESSAQVFSRYGERRAFTDSRAGTGLGLSVVQHIAALHGGHAVLQSSAGKGTRVIIRLPERRPPSDAVNAPPFEYADPMNRCLTELADVLDYTAFIKE